MNSSGRSVQNLLLRYTQALITQMAQTAVCNRHHSVEQQLCRWLLMSLDRLPSNELTMTQELIANMLGVRREGVTESAGKLQKLGLIHYNRGHIVVIDRPGLESLLRVLCSRQKNSTVCCLGSRRHQSSDLQVPLKPAGAESAAIITSTCSLPSLRPCALRRRREPRLSHAQALWRNRDCAPARPPPRRIPPARS